MTIAYAYVRNFRKQTKYYYAQWLPTAPLQLGVVGEVVDKYFFRPKGMLRDFGIDFDPQTDVTPDPDPSPLEIVSSKGVSITSKLQGEANATLPSLPQAKAGLAVEFSAEGAFIIKSNAVFEPRLRSTVQLEQQILQAYRAGRWPRRYAVVYSLVQAPYADILISESSNSKLELQAEGDGQIGKVELGNVEIQFAVKHQSGAVFRTLGARNITPAFQLIGIKRRLFGVKVGGLLDTLAPGAMALAPDNEPADNAGEASLYVDTLSEVE